MSLNATRLAAFQKKSGGHKEALWEDIKLSLPRAVELCQKLAGESQETGEIAVRVIPPRKDLDLTRQITALLGVDRYRELIEEDTGMRFVLGGCCGIAVASTREAALNWLTWEKQFELQTISEFMC